MKRFILLYIICLFCISCMRDYSKINQNIGLYNIDSIYYLETNEFKSIKDSNCSKLAIDSMQTYLLDYRYKLSNILKKKNIDFRFDKAFLIESFFVYKKGYRVSIKKDYLYDYRATLYMENKNKKVFLDIEIAKKNSRYKIDRIRISRRRKKFIQYFFSKKTILNRQNISNCLVFEDEEQYAILSKISPSEKFCRIAINPFWNSFFADYSDSLTIDTVQFSSLNDFSILELLTGNGASF